MANNDLDALRHDPAFMMALGKAPGETVGLASQPTMSRWENVPDTRALIRLGREMVDIYCSSHDAPPEAVTLDIDDTFDAGHGQQQLTFWNGFHRERGTAPIHVYETGTSRSVAFILRPAKTPSGREIRAHVRRLIRRIRRHWPHTRITMRGDGHYSRPKVMAWCEAHSVDYIFGLPGNSALRDDPVIAATAFANVSRSCQWLRHRSEHRWRRRSIGSPCAVIRAERALIAHRGHCETTYAAKSWKTARRVIARIEATTLGMDIRTIVTSLKGSTPERLCEFDYCDRGRAENLIKLHKT